VFPGIRHKYTKQSATCLFSLVLLYLYYKLDKRLRDGFTGRVPFLVFTARFFIEFIKQNQETFEDSLALNMGQLLSIPFILIGLS
jgi:prolipoprotein diacylglyceryltransferase